MNCPYCNHTNTYRLNTGQEKCAKCKKKFSPKKIYKNIIFAENFCNNKTAKECSKELGFNYITVKKTYELFRSLISKYQEDEFNRYQSQEYDEYVYLPKSKKKIKENIFDAQNFLTFSYNEDQIYNLLMPNLNKYKSQFLDDGLEDVYFKEFSKFMMFNKIAKTNKKDNSITRFWNYFEDEILKYKGIDNENFFFYLKEFEFKFNHKKSEAKEILLHLIKEHNSI